jgi:hypothetical protein
MDIEVTIAYDAKRGKIVLSEVDEEVMKELVKLLGKKKKVTFQTFPDGFIVTGEGIFLRHADIDEPTGYA